MDQRTTPEYDKWLSSLRDEDVLEITAQIEDLTAAERLQATGLPKSSPHIRSVGHRVSEVKVYGRGPGYRGYFTIFGGTLVLLCGGRKDSQTEDIRRAKRIARRTRA